jgi:hypothetical protein
MILDVEEGTTAEELINMLIAAPGATISVIDADGNDVSGEVTADHMVKVVSLDGTVEVLYEITIIVSIGENRDLETISAYPNPTTGEVFITGLHKDSKLNVYNLTGKLVMAIDANELNSGLISLEGHPAGVYFITVKLESYHLKSIRVLKQ